jgi:hypothetical protein
VLVVGVEPVLDRIVDDIALGLVDPTAQEQPVDALGVVRVDVEPGLLVGDRVRELAGA